MAKSSLGALLYRDCVLVWLLLLSSMQVAGAAPCYTHDEARNLWPQAHLYWHGSAKCWDDAAPGRPHPLTSTSTSATSATPSTEPTSTPLSDAVRIEFPVTPKTTIYPELMPGSTNREMFNPASILTWPRLIDIDAADAAHSSVWNRRIPEVTGN